MCVPPPANYNGWSARSALFGLRSDNASSLVTAVVDLDDREVPSSCRDRSSHSEVVPLRPEPSLPKPTLSDREVEVLLAWFRSDSKSRAAHELFISIGTINTHIARIRTKYAAVDRAAPTKAALFVRALQDGLTSLDEW
jgi:DNA-binding CsgD family transcriptional regulator